MLGVELGQPLAGHRTCTTSQQRGRRRRREGGRDKRARCSVVLVVRGQEATADTDKQPQPDGPSSGTLPAGSSVQRRGGA